MPVGTYNATKMIELKRERLFKVSTHYVRCTRKNTVFDDFFHKLTKRITSESEKVIRRAKWDQRFAPLSVALG